ncbi:sulfotransferase family protein [Myceligenerans pegani]|uniref:Sulfotransferase n=1 Tax=Myceligenerans pegani TaxID=2776917 RepID=A0ABR9N5W7_9MICO|nr:sulfotransferase [Myceligenerans sp. TRM 65318]MBE1879049.1 sulfotransferase [Myceligenerans sp. TRM 65318]MBE3021320.1 sulfotransferase [Myceligenerans sp. TRM 65318]
MSRTTRAAKLVNTVFGPALRGRDDPAAAWAKAVARAERAAGTTDPEFAAGLGAVVAGVAEIPRLSALGWTLALTTLQDRYVNRLRINALLANRPEIADEPIERPVFVLGLPRTATTLAHRLLAASPEHRGPLLWEMGYTGLEDPAVAARQIKRHDLGSRITTALFAPGLKDQHPTAAAQPEESMWLLPHGFWQAQFGPMPSYAAWLAGRGAAGPACDFEHLKRGLQVLQHGRERRRWILKFPQHLNDMPTIKEVFPDATFVWTHRDPAAVVGSTCSLIETAWSLYQNDPDRTEIGRFVLDMLVTMVTNGLESRLGLPPSAIVDVPYHRLSAEPHAEVPRVYAAIGASWTTSDQARLDAVLARPAGSRPHRYDMTDYGLSPERVTEAFAPYLGLLGTFDATDAAPTTEL